MLNSFKYFFTTVLGGNDCPTTDGPDEQEADDRVDGLHHLHLPGLQGGRRREVREELALLDRWDPRVNLNIYYLDRVVDPE